MLYEVLVNEWMIRILISGTILCSYEDYFCVMQVGVSAMAVNNRI